MDISNSFDNYPNRRDLLRGFLEEYMLLAEEQPELVEQLSFDAYVHFSFAYYRLNQQAEGISRLQEELVRVRRLLPIAPLIAE